MRWLFVLLVLLSACAGPRVHMEWLQPPRFDAHNRTMALAVQAEAPTVTSVVDTAVGVTQGRVLNQWAAVEPVRGEFDTQLRRNGFRLVPQGVAADLVVRVTPVGWHYQMASEQTSRNRTRIDPRAGSGRLDLRVEVFETRNQAGPPVFVETYWAEGSASRLGEPEALTHAAERVGAVFLGDLEPTRVSANVELDDSDPITQPGIDLCKQGQLDAAYQAFTDDVNRAPQSAPALYDLAVLSEARAEYEKAELLLNQATALNGKALYYKALSRVRAARADAQALGH